MPASMKSRGVGTAEKSHLNGGVGTAEKPPFERGVGTAGKSPFAKGDLGGFLWHAQLPVIIAK